MLLSLGALRRFGDALSSGRMPLPPHGVPNDQHIATWAQRLEVCDAACAALHALLVLPSLAFCSFGYPFLVWLPMAHNAAGAHFV